MPKDSTIHNKLDKVIEELTKMRIEQSRMNEHLKTLNGKVARNILTIDKVDKDVDSLWSCYNQHAMSEAEWKGGVNIKLAMVGGTTGLGILVLAVLAHFGIL